MMKIGSMLCIKNFINSKKIMCGSWFLDLKITLSLEQSGSSKINPMSMAPM